MLEQKLKEAFYWFHQNPELSYEEYNTTAKIRELMEGFLSLPLPAAAGRGRDRNPSIQAGDRPCSRNPGGKGRACAGFAL